MRRTSVRNSRSTSARVSEILNGRTSSVSLPASILEKSRMSLISLSSVSAARRIEVMYSYCLRSSGVSSASFENPSTAFMGVRISWLMFARKALFASVAASAICRCLSACSRSMRSEMSISDPSMYSAPSGSRVRRAVKAIQRVRPSRVTPCASKVLTNRCSSSSERNRLMVSRDRNTDSSSSRYSSSNCNTSAKPRMRASVGLALSSTPWVLILNRPSMALS